ncbi:hypothetical protein PMAYCL1PPCAC_21498, partial [Pristionchus mayeri]
QNRPGYGAPTYWIFQPDGTKKWTWLPITTMTTGLSVIFSAAIIILLCLARILREMRSVKKHLESKTIRMQRKLVRALLWQTIVPIIFSYIPISIVVFAPLFT